MFDVPFEEIAAIVGRSPAATRQLASRARRRIRGASVASRRSDRQRAIVDAFLSAARDADFDSLVALLDPDVVLRADHAAVQMGASEEVHGATAVAHTFSGRALGARTTLLDGVAGLVWAPGGRPKVVWRFGITDGKVVRIDMAADPELLDEIGVTIVTA